MSEFKRSSVATSPSQTADEIFLSPRVVDRQAFNDFAGQLKELIAQAKAQTDALRSVATDAQRTRDGLRDATNANQMKLDMATRAIAGIDQKTEQIRSMIESAADAATRVDGLKQQADQVISERVGILCQRLGEAEDAAVVRVQDLHEQLAATLQRATESQANLKEACERAGTTLSGDFPALVQRAEALKSGENGLASMIDRAESAGRLAIRATSELGEIRAQADQARKILSDALNTAVPIIDEAGTIQGHLEATVSEAVRLSQGARTSMEEFVSTQRRALEDEFARINPMVEQTRAELNALIRQTGSAGQSAATAVADAEQACRGLANLLKEVEPWKRVLLSESPDAPVGAAINAMVVELKNEIRGVAGALRAIADRAETALEPSP